jgi:hypothetical protein
MSAQMSSESMRALPLDGERQGWRTLPASFAPVGLPRRLSLQWLVARLQSMSVGELGSRAWRSMRCALDTSLRSGWSSDGRAAGAVNWLPAPRQLVADASFATMTAADRILSGHYPLLNRWVQAGELPRWNRPFDLCAAPSPLLLEPALEVRYALELNRHGHLVTLGQAWLLSRDTRWSERIAGHLLDWIHHCPRGIGPGWSSAIEPSMRLLQWSVTWQWVADSDGPIDEAVRTRWLQSAHDHVTYIAARLSSHSSANNHLIAELTALVVAAATWPQAVDPRQVGLPALKQLEDELLAQHSPDGVNREQAIGYQVFVFDLFLLARLAAPQIGRSLRPEVDQRMADSARFVAAQRNRSGGLPAWGDSDDADAVPWTRGCLSARAGRMLALAAAVDVAPELAPLADRQDPALCWLGLTLPARHQPAAALRQSLPRRFAAGGYFMLGSDFGGPREVLACVDCGPLGYTRIAAHGHADALSLALSVGGQAVLVDRGTFSYNALPESRRRMRGTLQHNTVTVDGQDQSSPAGPFLWHRHANASCLRFRSTDEAGEFVGRHDGFAMLRDPVLHERRVMWDRATQRLTVTDRLTALDSHDIGVAWHFDPTCLVRIDDHCVVVNTPSARMLLRSAIQVDTHPHSETPGFRWLQYAGDAESQLGWHAASFGRLQPAPTLIYGGRADGAVSIVTTFDIDWSEQGAQR